MNAEMFINYVIIQFKKKMDYLELNNSKFPWNIFQFGNKFF